MYITAYNDDGLPVSATMTASSSSSFPISRSLIPHSVSSSIVCCPTHSSAGMPTNGC